MRFAIPRFSFAFFAFCIVVSNTSKLRKLTKCLQICDDSYSVRSQLANYFKLCAKNDSTADCFLENAKAALVKLMNGEEKFHLPSLSPFYVEQVQFQASNNLNISMKDVYFNGLETVTFLDGRMHDDELFFKGHFDNFTVSGKYDLLGRILVLPIQGNGDCEVRIENCIVEYRAVLNKIERKGKQYYEIESADGKSGLKIMDVKRVYWRFDNLFNGDKRLGDEMNRFLNENWPEVFNEIRESIAKVAAYSIANYYINGYLHYIPSNQLFQQ